MTRTLLTVGTVALLATTSLFADQIRSQNRIQETENVQYQYRYQPDAPNRYKGEYQPKNQYQYQYRKNMNSDPFGSGMGNMRSMGGSRGGGGRR